MTEYNYLYAMTKDIIDYIEENIDLGEYDALEELEEHLNVILWTEDSVTGNASGSYTFSTWKAEEYLCHNLDLLADALREFGCGLDYFLEKGAEAADVTIRCYLLGQAVSEALEEIKPHFESLFEA